MGYKGPETQATSSPAHPRIDQGAPQTVTDARRPSPRHRRPVMTGRRIARSAPAAVSLTVTPHLEAAAMVCHYRFTLTNGLPPREDRVELLLVGNGSETVVMSARGRGQARAAAAWLSESLLVPVFT